MSDQPTVRKPFFETERTNTDESLNAERDKTNDSLAFAHQETEKEIDKVVEADRKKADQKISAQRESIDARKPYLAPVDDPLVNERLRADTAKKIERTRIDAVIEQERDLKNALVSKLLEQERKLTDTNLSTERARTDSEVADAATELSSEVARHSVTKVSLTSREEFLAIVSHDLKNPIGAAASCAEMLLEDPAYKDLDPEVQYWIQFIKRNVDTSLRLIGDLLDVERMAQGKLILNRQKNDLSSLLNEMKENFTYSASAKSIRLQFLPFEKKSEVVFDRDRIAQVVSNLISNAIKFTPVGGSIDIEAQTLKNELQIHVTDTGAGIPEEKKAQIFERFTQLGSKDRRGLGLGLYISQMLIEAHQGQLWVASKVGQGSRFSFSLPL